MNNIIASDFFTIGYLYSYYKRDLSYKDRFVKIQGIFNFNKRVHVKIFQNKIELEKYVQCKLPDWIKGVAFCQSIMLIHPSGWKEDIHDDFFELFLHEYIHLAIKSTFYHKCPTWLNEGFAIYFSEQYKTMNYSLVADDYDYYGIKRQKDINYNQFGFIVLNLIDTYGELFILNRAKYCSSFFYDDIFGPSNLKKIHKRCV